MRVSRANTVIPNTSALCIIILHTCTTFPFRSPTEVTPRAQCSIIENWCVIIHLLGTTFSGWCQISGWFLDFKTRNCLRPPCVLQAETGFIIVLKRQVGFLLGTCNMQQNTSAICFRFVPSVKHFTYGNSWKPCWYWCRETHSKHFRSTHSHIQCLGTW